MKNKFKSHLAAEILENERKFSLLQRWKIYVESNKMKNPSFTIHLGRIILFAVSLARETNKVNEKVFAIKIQ